MSKKFKIFLAACLLLPFPTLAQDTYPRLANYYLSFFKPADYAALARYDLLIIQPEMVHYQAPFFAYYRQTNPAGRLLAYVYPAMFYRPALFYDYLGLRRRIFDQVENNNWWLRDEAGEIVAAWPQMSVINLSSEAWREFNVDYLKNIYRLSDAWDGLMYDLVDSQASLYSSRSLDINGDGRPESAATVNREWQSAMIKLLARTRYELPEKTLLINGNSLAAYQASINGRLFENFPTPWEGSGQWTDSMRQYLRRLPTLNQAPTLYVINAGYRPDDSRNLYQQLRFALGSVLLGDGYFSFDDGVKGHAQTWWFDEYEVDLGTALGRAYNVWAPANSVVQAGLWRRDFARGSVLVNAGTTAQTVYFPAGQFKRLAGVQAPQVNDGQAVERLTLCPEDGIILLRRQTPQPPLDGVYLSCWAPPRLGLSGWREILPNWFNLFTIKAKGWFNYFLNI